MFSGYIGTFAQTLDEKNRVVVPAKFRALFEGGLEPASFYLTRGPNNSILMFTPEQWQRWEQTVTATTEERKFSGSVRDFIRAVYSNAHHCTCDKLGRITVPPSLLEHAKLAKDVVIIGVKDGMEIWSAEEWNKYQARVFDNFDSIVEDISKK